jgi:general stress protein YciG
MENKTRLSGFASMDESKQREIARKGGMAAHRKGTAHEFTAEEARFAGRKGGQQVSANRSHMIEIGRLGGKRSAERRKNRAANTTTPTTPNQEPAADNTSSESEPSGMEVAESGSRQ